MTLAPGTPVWGGAAPLGEPASPPRRAEVVIVGGGITGVALLGALVDSGVDAILVERDQVACGASGRNAGFLLAGVAENYARAVERYGRLVAAEVWALTSANHALVAALPEASRAGHARRGSLTLALDLEEAASLEEAVTLLAEDGFTAELRSGDLPAGAVLGLYNPHDGEIDPRRLTVALAAAHPHRVFEAVEAIAVADHGNAAVVATAAGDIEAAAVVLATNAWTSTLMPDVAIRPVRAQMLATAPAAGRIPIPTYAQWGYRYWRQRDDGTVLVGGFRDRDVAAEVGLAATPTAAIQGHLDAQLRELGIAAPVTHRWAGIMGFSNDGLPLVGAPPGRRRVHVCGGYTGHGMGFALAVARALADHLADSAPLPSWLAASRPDAQPAADRTPDQAGSRITNVVPWPSSDSTRMLP